MKVLRTARWLLLALLLSVVPASSFAGVFISVGFAPPVLPVYEQPPCPEEGLMWSPGYWAYGDDGYYWVPGTWVPAPYEGALWTPPYWGWSDGLYVFHDGYWGRHVGYYGGVNYGFGYMGIGFVGGEWHGRDFAYNTAVMRVNRVSVHNTYVNETVVHNTTIINNNRVAYSGGPGGIRHDPRPEERMAMRESHVAPTTFQQQHIMAARVDRSNYAKTNGGRPQNVAVPRPLSVGTRGNVDARPVQPIRQDNRPAEMNRSGTRPNYQPQTRPGQENNRLESRPGTLNHQDTRPNYQPPTHQAPPEARPNYQSQPQNRSYQPEFRPAPPARPEPQRQAPQARPEPQRQAPQARPEPQRQAPQARPEPQRQAPQARPEPQRQAPQARPEPQRQAPQARPEPQRQAPQARPEPQRQAPQARPEPQRERPHR